MGTLPLRHFLNLWRAPIRTATKGYEPHMIPFHQPAIYKQNQVNLRATDCWTSVHLLRCLLWSLTTSNTFQQAVGNHWIPSAHTKYTGSPMRLPRSYSVACTWFCYIKVKILARLNANLGMTSCHLWGWFPHNQISVFYLHIQDLDWQKSNPLQMECSDEPTCTFFQVGTPALL